MTPIKQLLVRTLLLALASGEVFAAAQPVAAPRNSNLDSELFYEILVGDINAQTGNNAAAFGFILNAARRSNSPILYEKAVNLALQEHAGDSALEAAKSWNKAFPESADANRYVFQILVGLNQIANIQTPMRRMLAGLPVSERITIINQLPRIFSRVSERKLLTKVVEQALVPDIALHATSAPAWAAIGVLRSLASDPKGALDAAQRGAAANPGAPEPVVLAIGLMASQGDAAESIVRKYMADKPVPDLRMAYTRSLLIAQRYGDAAEQMRRLTQEKPSLAEAWLLRGQLELEERTPALAETSLKNYVALASKQDETVKASGTDRNIVQAYFLLAQIAEQDQRLDAAIAYLSNIDSAQDAMRVQTRKALILARQGKMDEARKLVRDVPELTPEDARTKVNTEVALLREYKQYQAAYDVLAEAVAQSPQETDFLYEQALIAEKLGKTDEMERLLRQIIAIKPDHFQAYNALGYSFADRGIRLPEARQLITKAMGYLPNDPDLTDSLAWLEFRSGNTAEAERLLRIAFKGRPNPEIAAHLGEVLWSSGQREAAETAWKDGLQLSPKNDTLIETMNRLRGKP
jgi:tetratricopeptide (TPR) repeat protein